jgi:hypothetical protein
VEKGQAVLAQAVAAAREVLDERLVAAYALGSLAHGGFSTLVSDIDLGLILSDPLRPSDPETLGAIVERVKMRGPLHERLSVFWGTASSLHANQTGGRFPALDRLDLIENGRLLYGTDARQNLARPSSDELLVDGAEFALGHLGTDEVVEEVRRPELLLGRGVRRLTKLVLFPVRFLFTAVTGQVGTNAASGAHYLADDHSVGTALVAAGLAWRTSPPDDEAATLALLRSDMVPLYLHYLDDHIGRLGARGRVELAARFQDWRGRVLS